MNLRCRRPRRRKAAAHRSERPVLTMPNQTWSMDFVADALFDGRRFRALILVDNFSCECLGIVVDQSLRGEHVVSLLSEVVQQRGRPARIQTDNGPEFVSLAMDRWAYDNGATLDFSDLVRHLHLDSRIPLYQQGLTAVC